MPGLKPFRLRHALMLSCAAVFAPAPVSAAPPAPAQAGLRQFTIPAQDLADALRAFAAQSGRDVLFAPTIVAGKRSPGVRGALNEAQALTILLYGTGLKFAVTSTNGYAVQLATVAVTAPQTVAQAPTTDQPADAKDQPTEGDKKAEDDRKVERVLVTGTHIRGKHPKSSPLEIYTAKDIERSGATTTEQFIQKLPQNAGTRTQYGSNAMAGSGNGNEESVAGVDLRGLGLGTTLVLMNGRRLGLSDFGRVADVSMIPISAIERVEVLTDGASAIYGSDAIGGVVNFVLRKDFDGAETRFSYGGVTNGNLRQGEFNQTFGRAWGSGHGLVSYAGYSASSLDVADRDFAARQDRGTLTPTDQRNSLLLTGSQDIGDQFTVSADIALARRDEKSENTFDTASPNPTNWSLKTTNAVTDQIFANLSLDYQPSQSSLHGSVVGTYTQASVDSRGQIEHYNLIPPTAVRFDRHKDYNAYDLTATLDGALFALPGGDARFSLGAGLFDEEYSGVVPPNNVSTRTLGRSTSYAFGELYLPLIGAEQHIPLVHRLEVSAAARYTRYDDQSRPALDQEFGDATDPKIGLLWAPTEPLALRATYGTSFRAPSLVQLDDTNAFLQVFSFEVPVPFPTGPASSLFFIVDSPVEDLRPETATTYTLGFDFRPSNHPRFRVSGTYYNISYEDRIGVAPLGGFAYLQTPELFPLTIYRPPSADFIANLIARNDRFFFPANIDPSDPAAAAQAILGLSNGNVWVVDQRFRNLALSQQDGFDLSISNAFDTSWGEVRVGANVTGILSYRQQAVPGALVISVVDRATRPVDLRGRAYVGISKGGFDGTLSLNYVDDYTNDLLATGGAAPIESWTTADLSLSYDFENRESGLLDDLRVTLSAQNLFDQDPPFVAGGSPGALFAPLGFDPANANPVGRVVVVGLSKRW